MQKEKLKGNVLAGYPDKQINLTKVMTLSKPSKDKYLQGLKDAIIKCQLLVPDSEKEEWEESDCALTPFI